MMTTPAMQKFAAHAKQVERGEINPTYHETHDLYVSAVKSMLTDDEIKSEEVRKQRHQEHEPRM